MSFWEIMDQLDFVLFLFIYFFLLKQVYMYDIGSGNDYHSSESYATYVDDVLLHS